MKNLQIFAILFILLFTALVSAETMENYREYQDGTKSASTLSCTDRGCCELYLNKLETGQWKYINNLNCINSQGSPKVYNNGKDADQPTTIITQKVEFTGKCPILVYGDKNSLVQDCRDSTINFTTREVVFTLGGFTLIGMGITYLFQWVRKKKATSSKENKESG